MAHDFEVMKFCVCDYLRYIKSLGDTMRDIECDIAYQSARLNLLGVSYDSVKGASCNDSLSEGVIKLLELRQRWSDEYIAFEKDLTFAHDLCRRENINRYVLYSHTVDGKTWADVAREVGYSAAHIRRLADIGIREIYYCMPEEWRRYTIPNAAPQ